MAGCLNACTLYSGAAPGAPQYYPQGWGENYQQWQDPGSQVPSKCILFSISNYLVYVNVKKCLNAYTFFLNLSTSASYF